MANIQAIQAQKTSSADETSTLDSDKETTLRELIEGLKTLKALNCTLSEAVTSKLRKSRHSSTSDSDSESDSSFDDDDDAPPPPGYFNARKAMRVLEDYLCLEIVQHNLSLPLASYSLKYLQSCELFKDGFMAVMTKHGLTEYHLETLHRFKKNAFVTPRRSWSDLTILLYTVDPDKNVQRTLGQLVRLLSEFTKDKKGYAVLKSPLGLDDEHDTKFAHSYGRAFYIT